MANVISRGIYFNRAQKRYLQVILMEERATIARELHDSLAQSLSFLRIQLTLLKREVPADSGKAMEVIQDFDRALASAYRQLRELLATFRLTIRRPICTRRSISSSRRFRRKRTCLFTFTARCRLSR